MENDVAVPSKSIFYQIFVDEIYRKSKLRDSVLFDWLKIIIQTLNLSYE